MGSNFYFFMFMFFIATGALAAPKKHTPAGPSCPALSEKIRTTKSKLSELVKLKTELDRKYGENIVEQEKGSEPILAGFGFADGAKLASGRKNLVSNVSSSKLSLLMTIGEYCKQCKGGPGELVSAEEYCALCAGSAGCQK